MTQEALTRSTDISLFQNRLQAANDDILTLTQKLASVTEARDSVLQTAISSSVRLCIVAPTVNVHVTDKRIAFRTK
jgi:hypothetical protein